MSDTYKGFTLNTVGSAAPWASTERTAFQNIIATLVMGCCTEAMDTNGHKHYRLHYSDGSAAAATVDSTGNITLTADIYNDSWQTFSPTITGWTGSPTSSFKYKTLGKLVFVRYSINGTGDSNATEFTLPEGAQPDESGLVERGAAGCGTSDDPMMMTYVNSTATKVVFSSAGSSSNGSAFGDGVTKWVCGQFWYHKA